jgi:hypothetical protein
MSDEAMMEHNNMQQILRQTDYVALKLAEGADPLEYAEVLKLRQSCRDKVNEWNGEDFISPTFEDLRNRKYREIAQARYNAEIAGVTINGVLIKTDRETQAVLTAACLQAYIDSGYSLNWKTGDGTFVSLPAEQIMAFGTAVRQHVQGCFDHEAELLPLIESAETEAELEVITW